MIIILLDCCMNTLNINCGVRTHACKSTEHLKCSPLDHSGKLIKLFPWGEYGALTTELHQENLTMGFEPMTSGLLNAIRIAVRKHYEVSQEGFDPSTLAL